jgi:prepilin-type N-terminal cleavage/methylation domain-containing protein
MCLNPTSVARSRAFTLIEIMMVVSIMGVVVMMGLPPFLKDARKAGMRKALNDVCEAARGARAQAVLSESVATMTVSDHSVSGGRFSGEIPEDVRIVSIGVNFVEYVDAESASARFFPTGISDEFEITMQDKRGEIRKVSLDIITGTPVVESLK